MPHAPGRTSTGALTVTLTLIAWSSVPLFLRYFADSIDAYIDRINPVALPRTRRPRPSTR